MSVRLSIDDDAQDREFARLGDTGRITAELEKILTLQFQAGQAAVHVQTGSLRASEEIDSDYAAGKWVGVISFGGASPGFPNDPVVYAAYEAARGGSHDYSLSIYRLSGRYRTAMREHLQPGGR